MDWRDPVRVAGDRCCCRDLAAMETCHHVGDSCARRLHVRDVLPVAADGGQPEQGQRSLRCKSTYAGVAREQRKSRRAVLRVGPTLGVVGRSGVYAWPACDCFVATGGFHWGGSLSLNPRWIRSIASLWSSPDRLRCDPCLVVEHGQV